MKPSVTWVLLADGAQAKVFSHSGAGTGLEPVTNLLFAQEPKKAREIMADRPGRSFSSVGDGRSAMEYSSDPVDVREERFVKDVAAEIDRQYQRSAFGRLVIAASPTALGVLRAALSDQVKSVVVAEKAKDLTNLPTPELEKHFDDVLELRGRASG